MTPLNLHTFPKCPLLILGDLPKSHQKYSQKSHNTGYRAALSSQKLTTRVLIVVICFQGILIFYFPSVRDLFDLKLFINTDPDKRLIRRVMRDTEELGRDLEQVSTA